MEEIEKNSKCYAPEGDIKEGLRYFDETWWQFLKQKILEGSLE